MNFLKVIETVTRELDALEVRYALIGGFAMALRGVQRSTVDMDFILALDDLKKAEQVLTTHGYRRAFQSENVSHYLSDDDEFGRIDILHAFRSPTLQMLERADTIDVSPGLSLPVVKLEDIMGLKIQAAVNDPRRATRDWSDIRIMLETCAELGQSVDWDLLGDYLALFQLRDRLSELKEWHGAAE